MKLLIKIVLGFIAAVVAIVALGFVAVVVKSNGRLHRLHNVPRADITIASSPAAIANGHHISVVRGCVGCHGNDLGGRGVINSGAMGIVYAPNLTRGQGGLPANFDAEDYERAIRHGLTPEGRGLILMPSTDFASLSNADMNDLIAYLLAVPAVNRANGEIKPGPIMRMLLATGKMRLAADVINHSAIHPAEVPVGVTADYGRYLAQACMGCHGENMSGGKIAAGPPDWPPAANLTPDAAGRIKSWQETDLVQALRKGVQPDGSSLNPVMPRVFGQMTDDEIQAVWLFLQTLPAAPTGSHT